MTSSRRCDGTGDDEQFYEIEVNGVLLRVPRQKIDELADKIAAGDGTLEERLAAAFGGHPHVDLEAVEEAEPTGLEEEEQEDHGNES